MAENSTSKHPALPGAGDVRRLCGNIADHQLEAILETGAGFDDIEAAVAWAQGEDDVMGKTRRPLAGPARAVYDILAPEAEGWDDETSR